MGALDLAVLDQVEARLQVLSGGILDYRQLVTLEGFDALTVDLKICFQSVLGKVNEIAKHKASVEDADTQSKVRKRSSPPSAPRRPAALSSLPHSLTAERGRCFPVRTRAGRGPCPTLRVCVAEGWRLPPLQVHQLYETMQRWSPIATSLPELVQRLVSIKQLHEQGGGPAPRGVSGHWGVGSPAPLPLVLGSDAMPAILAFHSHAVWPASDTPGRHAADDRVFPQGQHRPPDSGERSSLVGCLPSLARTDKARQPQLQRVPPRPMWWHGGEAGVWCEPPYSFSVAMRRLTTYLTCDPPSHHLADCTCFRVTWLRGSNVSEQVRAREASILPETSLFSP